MPRLAWAVSVAALPLLTGWLQGCGKGPGSAPPPPGQPPAPPTPGSPPAPPSPPPPPVVSIWQFRSDVDMGIQWSYDLSGDYTEHGFYGGCWREKSVTLANEGDYGMRPAKEQWEDKDDSSILYGSYDGETGLTMLNKRDPSNTRGCLMRKTRVPIDLSKIGRIELVAKTSGSTGKAPWYALWLTPMVYGPANDNAKAAEIDIIENYDWLHRGEDVNSVKTAFAQCGIGGDHAYTDPFCKPSDWGHVATALNHHITVKATQDPVNGRVIRVYRCPLKADENLTTCPSDSPYAEILATKMPQPSRVVRADWFPVWNKDEAGDQYGMYWLVADIWWTSGTDFKLSVENVQFFYDNGTEWKMPLDGPPPSAAHAPHAPTKTFI